MERDDIIKLNVPLFLRLLELVREEVKDDVPLHTLTEIAVRLSNDHVMTMADYENILAYMSRGEEDFTKDSDGYGDDESEDELETIKRLGGMQ
jgi:hypothetical protein